MEIIYDLPSVNVGVPDTDSNKISEMLKKRRQKHKNNSSQMKRNICDINNDFEMKIKAESEKTKIELLKLQNDLEMCLVNMTKQLQDQETSVLFNEKFYEDIENAIAENEKIRNETVGSFHEILCEIEKERSAELKHALKLYYEEEYKILYKTPWEIDYYFEHKIHNINGIILNNHRCYVDLRNRLKLQIEYDIYKANLRVKGLKFQYEVISNVKTKSIQPDSITTPEPDRKSKIYFVTPSINSDDLDAWCREIQYTLNYLDKNSRKLVSLYKNTVINIFHRYFDQLKIIMHSSLEEDYSEDGVNDEVFKAIIDDIMQQYSCDIQDIQRIWNGLITYMQDSLKNNQIFLYGCLKLWDPHFKRIREMQDLILKDLSKTIEKHDAAAQNFEENITLAVDKLRQAQDIQTANNLLKSANKILDSIEKKYQSQCDFEIKVAEKYYSLLEKEIDVLLGEVELFLNESINDKCMPDPKKQRKRGSQERLSEDLTKHWIPYQISVCKCQIEAVNNWMFGLWEAVKTYLSTCRKEITDEATIWVGKQVDKLKKRHEIRITVHKLRYERLEKNIHDVRVDEIKNHLGTLEKIENQTRREIDKSRAFNDDCNEKLKASLADYGKIIEEIDSKIVSADKSLEISSVERHFLKTTSDLKEDLEKIFVEDEDFASKSLAKIKQIIAAGTQFIKLFSNNGRYDHDEAKSAIKKIAKLYNTSPKHFLPVIKTIINKNNEIFETISRKESDLVSRILRAKTELEFNEKITSKVCTLQRNIRRLTYEMKFKIKQIEKYLGDFTNTCKLNLVHQQNFNLVGNNFAKFLKKLFDLSCYVVPLEKENCEKYWFNVVELVNKTRNEIKTASNDFYENIGGAVVYVNKIQPDSQAFINETENLLSNYTKQSKIVWLECLVNIAKLVLDLFKFLDEFHVTTVVKYINNTISSLQHKMRDKLEDLKKRVCEAEREFVDSQRCQTESEAENYLEELDRECVFSLNQAIDNEKESLRFELEQIIKNITEIHSFLKDISNNKSLHDFINNLIGQLEILFEKDKSNLDIEPICKSIDDNIYQETNNVHDTSEMAFLPDKSPSNIEIFRNFFKSLEDEEKQKSRKFLSAYVTSCIEDINLRFEAINLEMDNMKFSKCPILTTD